MNVPTGTASVAVGSTAGAVEIAAAGRWRRMSLTGSASVTIGSSAGAIEIAGSGTLLAPSGSASVSMDSTAGALEIAASSTLPVPTGSAAVSVGTQATAVELAGVGTLPVPTGSSRLVRGRRLVGAGSFSGLTGSVSVQVIQGLKNDIRARGLAGVPTGGARVHALYLPTITPVAPRTRLRAENGLDYLITQYASSTRLRALIQAILNVSDMQVLNVANELQRCLNIDLASGYWLDRIGRLLGIERPSVVSADYDDVIRFGVSWGWLW